MKMRVCQVWTFVHKNISLLTLKNVWLTFDRYLYSSRIWSGQMIETIWSWFDSQHSARVSIIRPFLNQGILYAHKIPHLLVWQTCKQLLVSINSITVIRYVLLNEKYTQLKLEQFIGYCQHYTCHEVNDTNF